MNLQSYSLEDCIVTAYKSEIEAAAVYAELAEKVPNAFLKDRLNFLAEEERKHQKVFEKWFREEFPDKDLTVPEESPVPLPEIVVKPGQVMISDLLEQAKQAEDSAYEFYRNIADQFSVEDDQKKALYYIASMEKSHSRLIEIELENAQYLEDFHIEWPMMHVGP